MSVTGIVDSYILPVLPEIGVRVPNSGAPSDMGGRNQNGSFARFCFGRMGTTQVATRAREEK